MLNRLKWLPLNLSKRNLKVIFKVTLCGKRLYRVESVKYLGVKIDVNLNWLFQVNDLSVKLNRANTLLFKLRKYDSPKTLRSINFAVGLRVLELFN